jgi:glycosyltransferase involved in cell wall biosynthesis
MNSVVWLANNVSHYHRARADAFASKWSGRFELLELSNRNELAPLQSGPCDIATVTTLFPGVRIAEIRKAELRSAILRHLDKTMPDVCCVNGWNMPGTAVMLDWAIRHKVPCVVMSDSNERDSARVWWKEEVKRRFIAQCSAALVAGSLSRDYMLRLGMAPENIFDGYDVVDNEHFRSGAERANLDSARIETSLGLPSHYFLACARFEPKKNLRRLIEAYGAYIGHVELDPWQLVIVGDGPSRADLESLAGDLGIGKQVVFKGLIGYQELPEIYGLAKAFIHASSTEQWGLVVNEAMAAGLPVLVSDRCGCVSDLVRDGVNGFTFDPLKPGEIAQKMLLIYRDVRLLQRMGQESTAIIADWGPERFAEHLQMAIKCAVECGPSNGGVISKAIVRGLAVSRSS